MRKGSYGVDAPGVPIGLTVGGLVLLAVGIVAGGTGGGLGGVLGPVLGSLIPFASAAIYLHATLRGKFLVWSDLLDQLALKGDERVLDLGCGRGAVLMAVAQRLDAGRAVGVDLWRSVDQSGNSEQVTQANAQSEGVAAKVELHTGDMTELPFTNGSFDVIVSSLAIHNIPTVQGRRQAIDEAFRVLRPGGRMMLVDIRHAPDYAARLTELGLDDVAQRPLGPRFWFGSPWVAARLVTCRRP